MRLLVSILMVFSLIACDSEPCEDAAAALEQCNERLDCRDVDVTDRSKCTTAKDKIPEAVDNFRSLPCTAQLKDRAELLNSCDGETMQKTFCSCSAL